ncbi:hypothetical protein FACS189472_04160 [Alphaproteobacteria bacterium]|nr:hypothetical protein FACS189472_04160 [Alphaproteobacteria bacterium]
MSLLPHDDISFSSKAILMLFLFLSWGVNQIINDYINLEEDRINAPNRPMVTGALPANIALAISASAICVIIIYSLCVNAISVIPIIAGVVMNIVYSHAKAYGIVGNLTFGISISCCAWYAYVLLGGGIISFFTNHWMIWLILVVLNMIMTYFTYFKDLEGDKAAGKNTLIVKYGRKKASRIGFVIGFIPFVIFMLLGCRITSFFTDHWLIWLILIILYMITTYFRYFNDLNGDKTAEKDTLIVKYCRKKASSIGFLIGFILFVIFMLVCKKEFLFWMTCLEASCLHIYTGYIFLKKNVGALTYFNLKYNFRALCLSQSALVCLNNPIEGLLLSGLCEIGISIVFEKWYTDATE